MVGMLLAGGGYSRCGILRSQKAQLQNVVELAAKLPRADTVVPGVVAAALSAARVV
jgi:hypothetical protein